MASTNLGEIADIITGPFGSMLHKSDYKEAGTPVIMPQDIGDRTLSLESIARIGNEDVARLARYATIENDIVYARRGDVEKHAYITSEQAGALCGTGCLRVRVNEQLANPLFVSFYLNRPESKTWIRLHAVGSNMLNINTDILSELPLELPELDTQRQVGSLLRCIDNTIANNKKLMMELESTARLIYDYWFTQFDFPDINGRPYRSSGGKMVWSDELKREIPARWVAGKTGCMIEDIRTGLNPRTNFTLKSSGIAYLTVKNITSDGDIDFTGCDFIDEHDRTIVHRRSDVSKGDILFASIAPLGRCYLVRKDPETWDINESVFSVRPNVATSTPEFLFLLLTSEWFIKAAEGSSAGSIFKGIRNEELRNLDMPLPSIETIRQFTETIRPLMDQIGLLQDENRELTSLRNWLLPMLMNGQATIGE